MDFLAILNNAAGEILSPTTAAFALATIGLNVHFGYSGLLNFGQAGFMAVGAYAFAIFTIMADPTATLGWPVWLSFLSAVLVAIVAAVIFGLILGIPTLRLRGDYLAIVTIAAAEIIRFTVRTQDLTAITGGSQGLTGASFKGDIEALNPLTGSTYGFGPWTATAYDTWIRIIAWSVVIVALLLVWLLMRSPWGRVIKGIREDEDAVRSLGKNVYSYKMQALVLGGSMGTDLALDLCAALSVGVPKYIVSTVSFSPMIPPERLAADVQMILWAGGLYGLNSVCKASLSQAAGAVLGAARAVEKPRRERPLIGMTSFGKTVLRYMVTLKPALEARGFEVPGLKAKVILVRREGRIHAWRDLCPHYAGGTPMAWKRDAYLNGDRTYLACHAHGAWFDIETGTCVQGPCLGKRLTRVPLGLDEDGGIHLDR